MKALINVTEKKIDRLEAEIKTFEHGLQYLLDHGYETGERVEQLNFLQNDLEHEKRTLEYYNTLNN